MSTKEILSATSIAVLLPLLILIEQTVLAYSSSENTLDIDKLVQSSGFSAKDRATMNIEIARAANTSRHILLSSDGSYSWQFFPYNNSAQRLLVVLSMSYNTTVVWIANRDHPVSPNVSLVLQLPTRSLALQDEAGNGSQALTVWSPTAHNISFIVMNSTGNLYAVDSGTSAADGIATWQSFDDPTDVFVPGQRLRTNHVATASRAWNNWASGQYILKANPGGAVLYATFDYQQTMVPYQILNYGTTNKSLDISLHSPCNHTTILYNEDTTGVSLEQEGPVSAQCRQFTTFSNTINGIFFASRIDDPGYRFMRLMPTGDITSFFLSNSTGLRVDNELFKGFYGTYCKLPAYCGVNSLCSSTQSVCSCPTLFQPVDPSDMSRGCRLEIPLNCSIFRQHKFLSVSGANYYANHYLNPRMFVEKPSDCTDLCLENCSCTAAFYDNSTGGCYLYDQVQTMEYGPTPEVTAFLRVASLPEPDSKNGNGFLSTKVIVSVSAAVVVVVGFSIWITRSLMKKNSRNEDSDSEEEAFLEGLTGLPPRFSYQELHDATEGFSKKLGAGGSGAVYEGDLRCPNAARKESHALKQQLVKVAVKVLTVSEFSNIAASSKRQFRAEVAVLGNLNHVNLVQLMGFCAEGTHRLLIYEFLENGSLDKWIYSRSPSMTVLPWQERYQIALDTARGLAFLHDECRNKVVHLDVKPQNILLDLSFRAKLADFGMSKLMERGHNQTVTAMRGTPGYMAPEWFLNLPITDKSDVFSYGMVLLELVGGRKNLNTAAATSEEWYFPAWALKQAACGRIGEVVDKRLFTEAASADCDHVEEDHRTTADGAMKMGRLVNVAFWCIQEDASTRPSMTTVVLMLDEHLQVPDPPLDMAYVPRVRHPPTAAAMRGTPFPSSSSTASSVGSVAALDSYSVLSAR